MTGTNDKQAAGAFPQPCAGEASDPPQPVQRVMIRPILAGAALFA